MRVDLFHNAYQIGQSNFPKQLTTEKDIAKNQSTVNPGAGSGNAFAIKDTYEPSKEQVRVNFGGYDKNGRGGISSLGRAASSMPVQNDFSTNPSSSTNYIMDGLKSVLNTDEEGVSVKMKDAGLQPEDLVYPERAKTLSTDPATQTALENFATDERSSLLAASGMTNQELDNFVSAVR